jgi:hypothetical protein
VDFNGPCSDYRPGEDDLQAFDFIRQFRLDVLETKYPGVTKVRGSSRLQTAYRLETEADLVVPTRSYYKCTRPLSFLFNTNQLFLFAVIPQEHFPSRPSATVFLHLHFPDKEATQDGLEHNSN